METYTYKCPSCGQALRFDTASGYLLCDYCNQYYQPNMPEPDIKENETHSIFDSPNEEERPSIFGDNSNDGYMDVRVYICKSCGAEVMTNDVEVSKFCSYCAQPTILFDRVSKEKRPQKIIPFKISKEAALNKAKRVFGNAKYLDKTINDIKVESVYGIYMPYWVYNSHMELALDVQMRNNNNGYTSYERKKSLTSDILLDASERFNDDISLLLNPFNMIDAEDFNPSYLSGFYADRSDVSSANRENDAKEYLREKITNIIFSSVPNMPDAKNREYYQSISSLLYKVDTLYEKYELNSVSYIFAPVYFITFKVGYQTVIILVNGQTGKMIGNIPVNETLVKRDQKINMCIFAFIFAIAGYFLFKYMPILWSGLLFLIIAFFSISVGRTEKKKYYDRYYKLNSENMFSLSRNREG